MIVLLTAYLNEGVPFGGEDSEIKDFRIEFCSQRLAGRGLMACKLVEGFTHDDGCIPRLGLCMLVELSRS